jgi:hypothetical protein
MRGHERGRPAPLPDMRRASHRVRIGGLVPPTNRCGIEQNKETTEARGKDHPC